MRGDETEFFVSGYPVAIDGDQKKLKGWKRAIVAAARVAYGGRNWTGPVSISLVFCRKKSTVERAGNRELAEAVISSLSRWFSTSQIANVQAYAVGSYTKPGVYVSVTRITELDALELRAKRLYARMVAP